IMIMIIRILVWTSTIFTSTQCNNIHLGILIPIHGSWSVGNGILPIVDKAVEAIEKLDLLHGYNISFTVNDSRCSSVMSSGLASDMVHSTPSVNAFIGPGCSGACLSAGLLAHYWNKPMISYSCSSSDLEKRWKYSTFARIQPFSRTYSDSTPLVLRKVMEYYRWKRAAIIAPYGHKGDNIWEPIASRVRIHFLKSNITISYYKSELVPGYDAKSDNVRKNILEMAKKSARVIFILATREQVSSLLLLAKELNMLNGNYAFITLDFYVSAALIKKIRNRNDALETNQILESFNGLISLTVKGPSKAVTNDIRKWLLNKRDLSYPELEVTSAALRTAPYLYDAIMLYAYAVNKTLQDKKDLNDGRAVFEIMRSYSPLFTDGSNSVRNSIITAVVVAVFLSVSAVIFYCRKRKYEHELLSKTWIIDYSELTPVDLDIRFASKVIRYCHDNTSKVSRLSDVQRPNPLSNNFGQYKNEFVALKRLRKDTLNLSRDMLIEMKQVRDIVHVNLVQFVGVCVNSFNICIVSQYCHRGSLQVKCAVTDGRCIHTINEILSNDDIKLDWFFRASFANDICMGMQAIHSSPINVHGDLRSSKCLIDNRWVCKIADYGLSLIKANQRRDIETGPHAAYAKLYWKAPELLNGMQSNKETTSQPGDVYSFGIVLNELITREEPYSTTDLSPRDVIARVCSRTKPSYRPDIPIHVTNIPMINLMNICWDDNPQVRPSFSDIKCRLKVMSRGKQSIVDNMLRLMENYTDQLEVIVEERTKQLAEEKSRTDQLLYKMLPRSIAESLKQGQPMIAESFKSVTIYFSDIVGFTSLASISTPLQVVHFLNDLYVNFDTIIDSFNVYKVETIGDAYMVVSGLPVPNGNKHAEEIATMSLKLLKSTMDFKIRHFESRKLEIRIGIHTGPCVAGIVGLKMPRYCLFGDTVNYASRMESSGVGTLANISPHCPFLL
ncbi:hypothetical protein QZH41_012417, partial [Actinostola sp. cb2023]